MTRTATLAFLGLLTAWMAGSCGGSSGDARQVGSLGVEEHASGSPDSLAWKSWQDRAMGKVDPFRGMEIYRQHCQACHRWEDDDVINALRGALSFPEPRARNLYDFIMHEDSLIRSSAPHVMDHGWEGKDWDHSQFEIPSMTPWT